MIRLPGLDLLRAVAIIWVMLFHSYIVGRLPGTLGIVGDYGWAGVDLFFVLSGYLIGSQVLKPLSQGQPLSFADFYIRRAFRIVPVLLVVLAVYFAWPGLREASGIQPLWQFLSFSFNWLVDYEHNLAFSHFWSLCVEEHFYLLFPVLAAAMTRQPSARRLAVACVAVVAGGMLVRALVWLHGVGDDGEIAGTYFVENIYYPTYTRLDGLLAGVVLACCRMYRPAWWTRLQGMGHSIAIAGFLILAAALWLFSDRTGFIASVPGYPLLSAGMALLVIAASGGNSVLARWHIPGTGWLARASYSLYLSHKLALHFVQARFAEALARHGVILFLAYALAVLVVGALLHHGIELPFLRLRDRLLAGRAMESRPASPVISG
jgi:peptidoglycan/LPS O-acetylase OafA/YrhL